MNKKIYGFPQYEELSKKDSYCLGKRIYSNDDYNKKTIDVNNIICLANPFRYCFDNNNITKYNIFFRYANNCFYENQRLTKLNIEDYLFKVYEFISNISRFSIRSIQTDNMVGGKYIKSKKLCKIYFLYFNKNNNPRSSFNVIKLLFENDDYTKNNTSIENVIFRKYIYPFFHYWDNLPLHEKYKLRKKIKLVKNNFLQYYFYKICDSDLFVDIGDNMFNILEDKKLADINFLFQA